MEHEFGDALMKHLALIALVLSAPALWPQAWSGLIAPNRGIDWTGAGATIPSMPSNCGTQPTSHTVAALVTAFNADRGGGSYCRIDATSWGTVTGSTSLLFSYAGRANVVVDLTGTTFNFTGTSTNCNGLQATAVCSTNGDGDANIGVFNWPNRANVSSGQTQGSTSVVLSSVTNLAIGKQIQFGQPDPASDNGNAWFCATTGSNGNCSQQGSTSSPRLSGTNYSQTQMVTVTNISGTTVTFTPALYAPNWGGSMVAWWTTNQPLSNFGIHGGTFDVRSLSGNGVIVELFQTANVWVDGTSFLNSTFGNLYIVLESNHTTLQNSYLFGSGPTSGNYAVDLAWGTSDSLVVNNISQKVAGAWLTETSVGNVFAYNYAVDNFFGAGWQACDTDLHAAGDYDNLYEGNIGTCFNPDDIHGTSPIGNTIYRSYYSGFDDAAYVRNGNVNPTRMVAMQALSFARNMNFVGSVWGTAGKQTVYQYAIPNSTSCGSTNGGQVFQMGASNQNNTAFSAACISTGFDIPNDTNVHDSLMRWGNWDVVTNAVRFCTANATPIGACTENERGNGASTYPGLSSPITSGFPASFIYGSKPSWFGSLTWPPVGPDVSGGNIAGTGGHANLNPAANCYLNVMGGRVDGTSGALTFNASTCYTAGPPPSAAPTNISIIVIP